MNKFNLRNLRTKSARSAAFTLVELLVVMAIIAILVTLIIYAINAARMQSRNSQRRNIVNTFKAAQEAYYSTNKEYWGTGAVQELNSAFADSDFNKFAPGSENMASDDPTDEEDRMCFVRQSSSTYILYIIPEPTTVTDVGSCAAGTAEALSKDPDVENFSVQK